MIFWRGRHLLNIPKHVPLIGWKYWKQTEHFLHLKNSISVLHWWWVIHLPGLCCFVCPLKGVLRDQNKLKSVTHCLMLKSLSQSLWNCQSVSKYLLNVYHMLDTMLGSVNKWGEDWKEPLASWSFSSLLFVHVSCLRRVIFISPSKTPVGVFSIAKSLLRLSAGPNCCFPLLFNLKHIK